MPMYFWEGWKTKKKIVKTEALSLVIHYKKKHSLEIGIVHVMGRIDRNKQL